MLVINEIAWLITYPLTFCSFNAAVWTHLRIGRALTITIRILPSLTLAVPTWLQTKPVRLEALTPTTKAVTPSSIGWWCSTLTWLAVCLLLQVVCNSFAWYWPCGCCSTHLYRAPLSQRQKRLKAQWIESLFTEGLPMDLHHTRCTN